MISTNHDETIQAIKRRRLAVLEEQQAFFGPNTPAHILMEIRDLRQELGLPDPSPAGDPPTPVVQPVVVESPDQTHNSAPPHQPQMHELFDYIKRHVLVVYTVAWLVSAVFVMGALKEAFELSQCVQRIVYSLVALGGGLAILGISLLPVYRPQYKQIDRLLTVLVTLAAAGLAAWLAYGSCLPAPTQPLSPAS